MGDNWRGGGAYTLRIDADFPLVAKDFKAAIASSDAVLFVTPEYSRSIRGGLKNAIDWGSRPYGKSSFSRKPSAVIGTSPGSIGTAIAQQQLKSVLSFCASMARRPAAHIVVTRYTAGIFRVPTITCR